MDEAELRRLLRLGLGRAILYAQTHDMREFSEVILDACLHCFSYDVQCEGTRASYMYDLAACLPDKDFYRDKVLESLKGSGDDYDAAQRFHFAACMADDGSEQAKRAMYEAYDPGTNWGEHIGIEFLQMDGIKGFLFVADKIGALLMEKPDEVDTGYLLMKSLEVWGEQPTWDALREAGATNPRIEKYRLVAEESHRRDGVRRPEIPLPSYQQLSKELPFSRPYSLLRWGERASDEELQLAARGLIAAKDSKQQLAHLRIFARRRFPLDLDALLALAEVEEERVGIAAMKALRHIVHPALRALALRLVETRSSSRSEVVNVMDQNFERGDHQLVLRWFREEEDDDVLHSMGMDSKEFWKRHPDEETEAPMLQALYEKGPCSFCREGAVRRMIERGALPGELRAECAWDANGDIRDLVAGKQLT
jgi:hypothetical protein